MQLVRLRLWSCRSPQPGSARRSMIGCSAPQHRGRMMYERRSRAISLLQHNNERVETMSVRMNIVELPVRAVSPDLIARFAAIVGDRYAVTTASEIAPYLTEERGLFHGRSPLVLRPGSVDEVAAILKLAN